MKSLQIKPKVLVVEDEPTQRRQLSLQLAAQGYEVLEAVDGRDGAQIFMKTPDLRLVLTDILMPEMDGFQLVEFLREMETRYVYIIVLTILEDRDSIVRALSLGADDYICKPVFKEELLLRLDVAKRMLKLEIQNALVFSMANLASLSSGESGRHLYRVRDYCLYLALDVMERHPELGLTKNLCQEISDISSLHDIGKMVMPEKLDDKSLDADAEDLVQMRRHPVVGGDILKDICKETGARHLQLAYEMVMFHHESWDGSGYPEGLVGNNIPLVARIMALADSFDALAYKQRIRKMLPYDEVRNTIIAESGKQFDPMIVEAFLRQEEKLLEVLGRYEDEGGER